MAKWLKTVRIRARNVPRIHGHKHLDNDVFLASLSRCRKATVLRADAPRCHLLKHKKIVSGQPAHVWQ